MGKAAAFLNKLAEDEALQSALTAAAQTAVTKEEKVAATTKLANEAGFDVSAEELQKLVESIQNAPDNLSDEDLDNVSGGVAWSGTTSVSIGAVSIVLSGGSNKDTTVTVGFGGAGTGTAGASSTGASEGSHSLSNLPKQQPSIINMPAPNAGNMFYGW